VPVEWNDAFVQTVDQRGGAITAAYQLDEKLILFKEDTIFATVGDGPTANGLNNDYAPAALISSDAGCDNQRSIVTIPSGLVFQSTKKGIYKLDRSLQVSYVGAAMEAFTQGAVVTSAKMVPNTTQVRFTLDTGVVLVFDYLIEQWSTFTGLPAADAVIFRGEWTTIRPDGELRQESPTLFTDDGKHVSLKLKTAWLSMAGISGWQRVRELLLLGQYISPHKLRVSIAYDFDPEPKQVSVYDAATLLTDPVYGHGVFGIDSPYGGEYPLYLVRVALQQQKATAIQVTIEDMPGTPLGEGYSLSAMAVKVGVKQGNRKTPAKHTVG
jgi:hypothetical protein